MLALKKYRLHLFSSILFLILIFFSEHILAQRMGHGASRGMSRGGGGGGGFSRPSSSYSGGSNKSINGGAARSNSRPSTSQQPANKANTGNNRTNSVGDNKANTAGRDNKANTVGDNKANTGKDNKMNSNDRGRDNKQNDRGRDDKQNDRGRDKENDRGRDDRPDRDRETNINIDNSTNVIQKNNIAAYHHPPYMWGGAAFFAFHPYMYHPFTPFYWGPMYHPWGFFVAALAITAIIVSVDNEEYHYDEGTWYQEEDKGGYTVVEAPVGGTVTKIPSNSQPVTVNNTTNYYYGGTFYEKDGQKYKVVPPPAGAVVDGLPEGAEEVKIGDQTYVKYGDVYYQPVKVDGKDKYEVVQVEKEEDVQKK
jgi:hypothetical protein